MKVMLDLSVHIHTFIDKIGIIVFKPDLEISVRSSDIKNLFPIMKEV